MNKDKFEQYIINNKHAFDTLEPSANLWEGISKRQPKTNRLIKPTFTWAARIAAAIIIFIGSYYFHDYNSKKQAVSIATPSHNNTKLYNRLIEAEYYYTNQIDAETEKFYRVAGSNTLLREEMQTEFKELETEFNSLKNDLKDNADNEEIINAMILNYRLKLRILQDMMNQLQQNKKVKNNKDESNLISI